MSLMTTRSGARFDLRNPVPADISKWDISMSLSRICRYNGHTLRHYSVAEHCCLLAMWFREAGQPRLALLALLHDAHEAYVSDLPWPVKACLSDAARAEFAALETGIDAAIYAHFGVTPPTEDERAAVKRADLRIVRDEMTMLFPGVEIPWGDMLPLGVAIPRYRDGGADVPTWLGALRDLGGES